MHPVKGGALLHSAGGDDCPDLFAESTATQAACALGDMPIHDDEAHGLFGGVIGRLDPRRTDEAKVSFAMPVEAKGDILD